MTKQEIKSVIIRQILEIAPDIEENEIIDDENIQSSLDIDSFDFLKILTAMFEEIGVEVPESDYSQVDTLTNMVEYFSKRL